MSLTVVQAYDNIEKIITHGFLTAGVSYAGHHFLLKSMTDKEYGNLALYRRDDDVFADILYHLSFCTVFIDSSNFLENRFIRIPQLVQFYSTLPVVFVTKIKDTIQKLNKHYLNSLSFLEGFCYTDKSRYLWRILNLENRDHYLGIAGLSNVGMNSVQENWIVINKRLDEEELYSKDLNLALLISSAMNPKGTKVISRNYDTQKKELDELRKDIAEYGYDRKRVTEQKKKSDWSAPVKSREDLVRELYRQMEGKKDKHDLFIEEWVRSQQSMAEEAKKQAEDRQKEFRAKIDALDMSSTEGSKPISASELRKILADKKELQRDAPIQEFMTAAAQNESSERFLKKISSTVIRASKED